MRAKGIKNWTRRLIVLLFCAAATLRAEKDDKYCGDLSLGESQKRANGLTGKLMVASYRGDLKVMSEIAADLSTFLDVCAGLTPPGKLEFSCIQGTNQTPVVTPTKAELKKREHLVGKVCDYDCHVQLARYHLFMSGDFLYMSNQQAGGNPKTESELLQLAKDHADSCAEPILKRGLKNLLRQANTCVDPNAENCQDGEKQKESFELFIRKQFTLNRLLVQTLIASGDLSYQATSDLALKKAISMVDEALEQQVEVDNTLEMAYARYKKALWTTIEMKTDTPNMPRFDDLAVVTEELNYQSKRRLNSIEKGFLYLDIDPDIFSTLSIDHLKHKLTDLKNKVRHVEGAIADLIKRGLVDKKNEANQAVDEKRTIANMDINIKTQKMLKLQNLAQINSAKIHDQMLELDRASLGLKRDILNNEMTQLEVEKNIGELSQVINKLESKVLAIEAERMGVQDDIMASRQKIIDFEKDKAKLLLDAETLNYRKQIRRLEFDLRRTIESMESEKKQIDNMQTKDLLALNRGRIKEQQAKYQWLINFEITNLNLDLHIKSLGAQVFNYARSIEGNIASTKAILSEGEVLKQDYAISDLRLREHEKSLEQLFYQKYVDHIYNRLEIRSKICAAERQLAYFGIAPQNSDYPYTSFGNSKGVYEFPEIENGDTFDNSMIPPIAKVSEQGSFGYKMFQGANYPQKCLSRHHEIFDAANITTELENPDNPDIRNLVATDFPYVENFKPRSENRIEDLFLAQGLDSPESKKLDLRSLLDESNKPCGFEVQNYSLEKYHKKMCGYKDAGGKKVLGLRETLLQQRVTYLEFLEACIYGTTGSKKICKDHKSFVTLAKNVQKKQLEAAQREIDTIASNLQKLKDFKKYITITGRTIENILIAAQAAVQAAAATNMATQAMPVVTTGVGMSGPGGYSVVETTIDFGKQSKATFDWIKFLADSGIAIARNEIELQKTIKQLEIEIDKLDHTFEALKTQKSVKELANLYTLAELQGQKMGTKAQADELKMENLMIIEDCEKSQMDWANQVETVVFEHRRLLNQLAHQNADTQKVDYEIAKIKARADQEFAHQEQIRTKIAGLNLSIARLRSESVNYERLIENSVEQMCMIANSKDNLVEFNQDLDEADLALALIDDAMEKSIIDGHNISREKLETALRTSEKETAELLRLQNESIEIANASHSKTLGILKSKSEINTMEKMLNDLAKKANSLQNLSNEHKRQIQDFRMRILELTAKTKEFQAKDLKWEQEQLDFKKRMNNLQLETHKTIGALRDEITKDLKLVLKETSGQKEFHFLNTQKAIANISMGIPEYVDVKKRLVQQVNRYLNFLRSRLSTLSNLNSESGTKRLTSFNAYIRNSYSLEAAIDRMLDGFETDEVEYVKGLTTTIEVTRDSAMLQELFLKKKVRFEVAPLKTRNESDLEDVMRKRGYYTLWSGNFEVPNARLVDIIISSNIKCPNQNIHNANISHLGDGYVFMPISTTSGKYGVSMISAKPRTVMTTAIFLEQDQDWPSFSGKWKNFAGGTKLRDFETNLKALNSSGASGVSGMFVGLPVSGVYEITLHENENCSEALRQANINIHFNFARDKKKGFEY